MRVLLTNHALAQRAGTELWVRDVAMALLARGHAPVAYSPRLGEVAAELRRATVPVVDDLDRLGEAPDLVHGHHHLETVTALLHFPSAPGLFVCHGWLPPQEAPPRLGRIRRYVAVDDVARERLIAEHGIPPAQVCMLRNFVDLAAFAPRSPLPPRPARALVFSNQASEETFVPVLRAACAAEGLSLDVVGAAQGTSVERPGELLGRYDVVFAKGRAALEAAAVGAFVIVCDAAGLGPAVLPGDLPRLRALNFGVRLLTEPLGAEAVRARLALYDPLAASVVRERLRGEAGLEQAMEALLAVYAEVLAEHAAAPAPDRGAELREVARYLRWGPVQAQTDLAAEMVWMRGSATWRWRNRLLRWRPLRAVYRRVSRRRPPVPPR
ncbi:MAG TPA: glycosyltransferase family 4 protein [Thermoanaerobaculia bacterium]|jgi:hypothetical protein|nr:glycosyltransferase family 4 protein [Thermoanaerobaculia bacterium]